MISLSKTVAIAAVAAAAACKGPVDQHPISQQQAERIADDYFRRSSMRGSSKIRTETVNGGKSWVVMYNPKPYSFGGTSFVVVHKITQDVVADFGYQ